MLKIRIMQWSFFVCLSPNTTLDVEVLIKEFAKAIEKHKNFGPVLVQPSVEIMNYCIYLYKHLGSDSGSGV